MQCVLDEKKMTRAANVSTAIVPRNGVNTHSNPKRKKSFRAQIRSFCNGAMNVLSTAAAWLYLVCYVAFWLATCVVILASFIVMWDALIIMGDPTSTWGPGTAYEVFCISWQILKYAAITVGAFYAFFGGTYLIGIVFRDARAGVPAKSRKSKVYTAMAIALLLPGSVLKAFTENAEDYWGTLQLIDLVMDRM